MSPHRLMQMGAEEDAAKLQNLVTKFRHLKSIKAFDNRAHFFFEHPLALAQVEQ